jgi:hypothetical protein
VNLAHALHEMVGIKMAESFEPNINEFLKDARAAIDKDEWQRAKECAIKVQAFDPGNTTAQSIIAAAATLPGPSNPGAVTTILEQAHTALSTGDWYGARERAIAVQALDPHNVEAERVIDAARDAPSLTDPQSGRKFLLRPESAKDWWAASSSYVYQIAMMLILTFLTLDTLLERNRLMTNVLGFSEEPLKTDTYKTLAVTFFAGALGGTLDAIRSLTRWHSEVNAYSRRFFLRDLAMPLSGALLAIVVYAVLRSGAGVLSGDFSLEGQTLFVSIMSASAIGFVAGFNSLQVYRWVDDVANRQFSTKRRTGDETPAAAATPAPATAAGAGDA